MVKQNWKREKTPAASIKNEGPFNIISISSQIKKSWGDEDELNENKISWKESDGTMIEQLKQRHNIFALRWRKSNRNPWSKWQKNKREKVQPKLNKSVVQELNLSRS